MVLQGTVQRGTGQAKERYQMPTANLDPQYADLDEGVFATVIKLKDQEYKGVCFIGKAWLLLNAPQRVEVHLLDYQGQDFYEEGIEVSLKHKIRDAIRFESESQAKEIIADDIRHVKEYFSI